MFKDGKVLQWNPSLLELTELRFGFKSYEMLGNDAFWSMQNVSTVDMSGFCIEVFYRRFCLQCQIRTVNLRGCALGRYRVHYTAVQSSIWMSVKLAAGSSHDFKTMSSLERLVLTKCMHDDIDEIEFEAFVTELHQALPT